MVVSASAGALASGAAFSPYAAALPTVHQEPDMSNLTLPHLSTMSLEYPIWLINAAADLYSRPSTETFRVGLM